MENGNRASRATTMRRGAVHCLFVLAAGSNGLGACTSATHVPGGLSVSKDAGPVSSVGSVVHLQPFHSELTGARYPIDIYLPEGYADAERDYPVIYATDAQWAFEGFVAELRQRQLDVVLVGIQDADRRDTDYLLPGARVYFEFLTTELMPFVQASYRVERSASSIAGTSYGGVLVASVLLLDEPLTPHFQNYLSFDGSFYESPELMTELEQQRYERSTVLNATVVLTRASVAPSNDAVVTAFTKNLAARQYTGLDIISHSIPVDHYAVSDPSFRFALDELFADK